MSPDDPRHGTKAGYQAHSRLRNTPCQPCRDAAARYKAQRELDQLNGKPPRGHSPVGPQRRLRALRALGYDSADLSRYLGEPRNIVRAWGRDRAYMLRSTAERISVMYEDLSMRLPPTETTSQRVKVGKARAYAKREGWAPPLAWDEDTIDDPDAQPIGVYRSHKAKPVAVDESVVQRFLSGEDTIPTNRAEKEEIMRRWLASGGSERELCKRTGWKEARYTTRQDGAA